MTQKNGGPARLGVDIGGTFTDVALEIGETRFTAKTLTTRDAPERGVLTGIRDVLATSKLAPGSVDILIYGTTLATNLLIERKGSPTALLTTDGFRDSVEMRNENRFEQYDVNIDLPKPLVPRSLRLPIKERVNARGDVLTPLDESSVEAVVPILEKAEVQSAAVTYLHSYANSAHEERTRDILARLMPDLKVSLTSEVSPEMREYERASTACANAYVQPLMSRHLENLERDLRAEGLACPLYLMLSGGGITTLNTAVRFPVRLVESGPAGGAIFASHIARELDLDEVVSYDMGGTTAKICLIEDGQPQTSRTFEVARVYRFLKGSGLPLRIPVIEMVEIGAGGGSVAHIDALGRIAVGPESAGSEPGPACYGRGGENPTVTDSDVVLGRIDPDNFAGGRMTLDRGASEKVLDAVVGSALELDTPHAALGVAEIVDENMANAARVHAIESGKDIERRTLVVFGGAAPVHAARMAEKLNIGRVVIPSGAGVGSAIGFLRAPVAYEVIRSNYQRLGSLNIRHINDLIEQMRKESREVVEPGAGDRPLKETVIAFMRYVGQGHEVGVEIGVQIAGGKLGDDGDAVMRKGFETAYHALYNRTIPKLDIEILTWSLQVSTETEKSQSFKPAKKQPAPTAVGERQLLDRDTGKYSTVPYYYRKDLPPGTEVVGPCAIVEDDTNTVVAKGYNAVIHPLGYIVMERQDTA
ncbi:MAG: hydantoinase/oxoprolinase family protein [Rhodospirillaceae bacterium]|nr:hydantoinase/oxoprolinase family protein [Rhodospirillaceae bacterium]